MGASLAFTTSKHKGLSLDSLQSIDDSDLGGKSSAVSSMTKQLYWNQTLVRAIDAA